MMIFQFLALFSHVMPLRNLDAYNEDCIICHSNYDNSRIICFADVLTQYFRKDIRKNANYTSHLPRSERYYGSASRTTVSLRNPRENRADTLQNPRGEERFVTENYFRYEL